MNEDPDIGSFVTHVSGKAGPVLQVYTVRGKRRLIRCVGAMLIDGTYASWRREDCEPYEPKSRPKNYAVEWSDSKKAQLDAAQRRVDTMLRSLAYASASAAKPGATTLHSGHPPTLAADAEAYAKARKAIPLATGCVDYFPDALQAVAAVSRVGNEQHNPGKPLFWDRSKSGDEADALLRHFVERGTVDTDGLRHSAKVAWRALALLQKEIEQEKTK